MQEAEVDEVCWEAADDKGTVCPRSCDPFYVVNYYIKRVTISLTYSRINDHILDANSKHVAHSCTIKYEKQNPIFDWSRFNQMP